MPVGQVSGAMSAEEANAEAPVSAATEHDAAEDAALLFKNKGNLAFKNRKYDEAIKHYTNAIMVDDTNHVLYSNRSASYLFQNEVDLALADAKRCVELNDKWGKGYGRVAAAYFKKEDFDAAIEWYNKGLTVEPANYMLKKGIEDVEKAKVAKTNQNASAPAHSAQNSSSAAENKPKVNMDDAMAAFFSEVRCSSSHSTCS